MKQFYALLFILLLSACQVSKESETGKSKQENIQQINLVLDNWHQAAADADFNTYFELMTDDAVFVGTDSSEVWSKNEFMNFSKPYFDKGKAWDFKKINRNVYLSENPRIAWFDETLNTWMGVCRGSGILEKNDNQWRIKHYVLSLTVPNEQIKKVIEVLSDK